MIPKVQLRAEIARLKGALHDAESQNIGLSARAINAEARLAQVADALKSGQRRSSLHRRIAAALAAAREEK